ncbi:MAG: MmgE/PrpD family protein, partial [SAR116 cluster bacterium]|nr:MmgE/PrpD family protein [SAR116 cluster bacterium]
SPMEAGRIGVEQVSGEGLADTTLHAMIKRKRISVAESDAHNATFPHTRDADVQITLNDGRVLDSGLGPARGGSERPMDESEIIAKFEDYASPVIGADRARAIVAAVTGMADGTCGLDDLRAHLYAPA